MNTEFTFVGLVLTPGVAYTYSFLFAALASVFTPRVGLLKFPAWAAFFLLAIISGLISGILDPVSLISIAIMAGFCYLLPRSTTPKWLKIVSAVIVTFLVFAFSFHVVPGFHPVNVIPEQVVHDGAKTVSKWATFDKPMVGLLLIGLIYNKIDSIKVDLSGLPKAIAVFSVLTVISFVLAMMLGLIGWNPKVTSIFIGWALTNLFLTCITEEAFFRGYFQHYLSGWLRNVNHAWLITILISGLFFGLVHLGGGLAYAGIAALTGVAHAYVYYKTKSVLAPVLSHFVFNLIHFTFFTYPVLA